MLKSRNNLGQWEKGASILITKKLRAIAEDKEKKVKEVVREKLKYTYIKNVYESYSPMSVHGKEVQEYNATHKHQKRQTYHHTGLLLESIDAVIDKNVIKIVIKPGMYDNGTTTKQVHDWLAEGTTTHPKKDSYPYADIRGSKSTTGWASYNPTPKHLFKEHTLIQMEGFLESLMNDLKKGKRLR